MFYLKKNYEILRKFSKKTIISQMTLKGYCSLDQIQSKILFT